MINREFFIRQLNYTRYVNQSFLYRHINFHTDIFHFLIINGVREKRKYCLQSSRQVFTLHRTI